MEKSRPFICPLCLSPLSVPLSEGGLLSENGWSDNNYLFESCSRNLNLKIRFVLMGNNGLCTCGSIDFCLEDCQVEIFFFFF